MGNTAQGMARKFRDRDERRATKVSDRTTEDIIADLNVSDREPNWYDHGGEIMAAQEEWLYSELERRANHCGDTLARRYLDAE